MNRLLITGTSSGCGKTTVTCALLSALSARGLDISAFKCGPDYIDPMFHSETAGTRSYNLDPFFLDAPELRRHIARHAGRDISVIEGAMGYYDGIAGTVEASAYTVAGATKTPVILVADARGVGNSIAAVLEGFKAHRPDSGIAGVIFNGITAARYPDMERVAQNAGIMPFGYLPFDKANSIGSRHLGLITAGEIVDIRQKLVRLGEIVEKTVDIDALLALSASAPTLETETCIFATDNSPPVKIAVSRDKAFCFIYRESLERFEQYGAEIVFFSPLEDNQLPEGISALYLCGGYPELYAEQLSGNRRLMEDIKNAVLSGLPTIAECGGFMILHDTLNGYPMAGVIPGNTYKTERLQRFGYVTLTALTDNLICEKGGEIKAHEFHYWDSDNPGDSFTARKAGRDIEYGSAYASDSMYAGYPHIYFTDEIAKRFVEKTKSVHR